MPQVAAVRTTVTAADLAAAVRRLSPRALTDQGVAMLVAQSSVETAAWESCWNWNFGNLMGTGGDYVRLTAYNGQAVNLRAYASMDVGAGAWLALITKEPGAVDAANAGDVAGFAGALKSAGYFQEPVGTYVAALGPAYAATLKSIGAAAPPTETLSHVESSVAKWALLAAGIGVTSYAAYLALADLDLLHRGRRYAPPVR